MPPDHEIPKVPPRHKRLRAKVTIQKGNGVPIRHPKTPVDPGARRNRLTDLFGVRRAAGAGVNRFLLAGVGRGQGLEDVLPGTPTGVNRSGIAKPGEGAAVTGESLALAIRCEGTAAVRTFLPVQTEPAQVQHGGGELRTGAASIEILVPQDQHAAGGPGALAGDPEGAGVAQVQVPGG